jgi:hypothetical protein
VIGDDVHIGANTCIDRGSWRDTVIERGARIDNLVHVAHNAIIGENAVLVAQSEVSGSVEVGEGAWIGHRHGVRRPDGRPGRRDVGGQPGALHQLRAVGVREDHVSEESSAAHTFTQEHLLRLFTTAPRAFWRHDIDVSLAAAAKMARFAKLAGVRSTFYLMARGEFYNPFSDEGADAVTEIAASGHRLGLHVDYRNGSVLAEVERDRALMVAGGYGDIIDPRLVSFHMPPACVLWRDYRAFTSAYAQRSGRAATSATPAANGAARRRRAWPTTCRSRCTRSTGSHAPDRPPLVL